MSDQELSNKMNEIMNRIKTRRIELNMSYQELADKTGLSKSTLQRYETGSIKNMPLDKLETIAKSLNITPAYLMGWEHYKKQIEIVTHTWNAETEEERDQHNLLTYYNKLNRIGKKKVLENAHDLSLIPSYCNKASQKDISDQTNALELKAARNNSDITVEELEKINRDFDKF